MEEVNQLKVVLEKAQDIYSLEVDIWCPYFKNHIALTSDGFNHLQNKNNRMPRNISEQILKLSLLPKAINVIKAAGTLQEYRRGLEKFGEKSKDGFYKTKIVEYWAFHNIFGTDYLKKIVVILKRVGDGKIIFWSVVPQKVKGTPMTDYLIED